MAQRLGQPVKPSVVCRLLARQGWRKVSPDTRHPKSKPEVHFIVMVVDGAGSHVAKALAAPENIRLHRLPGYSPEFNPQEHLRDEIREREFSNRVFCDMSGVVRTLETGLPRLAADPPSSKHLRLALVC